jgi:hypothetical protein
MNVVQVAWAGEPEVWKIPSNDITVFQFTTPATLGPKNGNFQIVPYPQDGAYGRLWPYDGAMNFTPGDITTNLAADVPGAPSTAFAMDDGPVIMFRGGPNPPPKQAQYYIILPNTDYCVSVLPQTGCPLPLIGVRTQLSAPRS